MAHGDGLATRVSGQGQGPTPSGLTPAASRGTTFASGAVHPGHPAAGPQRWGVGGAQDPGWPARPPPSLPHRPFPPWGSMGLSAGPSGTLALLPFAPLSPGGPLRPGRPGSPWKCLEKSRNQPLVPQTREQDRTPVGLGACNSPPVSKEQAPPLCGHPTAPVCGHPMARMCGHHMTPMCGHPTAPMCDHPTSPMCSSTTPMCGLPMAPGLVCRDCTSCWASRLGAVGREKALGGWWPSLLWPARPVARPSTFEPWSPRSPGLPASPT